MKLILHIGAAKAGSTSIQTFLSNNRRYLAGQGLLVPASLGHTSHRAVTAYAQDDGTRDVVRLAMGIRTADELRRFRDKVRDDFRREAAAAGCRTVVVSNEHCHARLPTVGEVARTRELFADFAEVEVLVYLRPQDELAVSRYSSLLRNGATRPDIFPPSPEADGFYDYLGLLQRWSAVYGAGAVKPFLFDEACRKEGLVAHFARQIGVKAEAGQIPPRGNPGLDLKVAAFLLELNAHLPKLTGDRLAPGRSWIREFCARHPLQTPILPSAEDAEAFLLRFEGGNDQLAEAWGLDARALSRPRAGRYPQAANWPARLERQELVGLFAEVLALIDQAPRGEGRA